MIFIAHWYNQDEVVKDDIIEADSETDARNKAYMKYDGRPPAPMLFLERK